jgi:hypothetical protein
VIDEAVDRNRGPHTFDDNGDDINDPFALMDTRLDTIADRDRT